MDQQLTLVFDIDGTLCPIKGKGERYEDLVPYRDMVCRMQEYHREGTKIILFTSRNMNSFGGNLGIINAQTSKTLLAWLDRWEIPYDELYYGKPWPGQLGFYVDDRTIRPKEFLNGDLDSWQQICREGRMQRGELTPKAGDGEEMV